ncbi:hypothetical protein OCU04_004458 [Sclerotinia nivalis]|uniref:Uncharacterized protein n=1 Tax=Sclerotinia nivalis TaxID=352851 RepID=A0A9X0AQJ2_9HELO|nr:hypothetical protein OCU04_004458 [Sclerotinia nivalis]
MGAPDHLPLHSSNLASNVAMELEPGLVSTVDVKDPACKKISCILGLSAQYQRWLWSPINLRRYGNHLTTSIYLFLWPRCLIFLLSFCMSTVVLMWLEKHGQVKLFAQHEFWIGHRVLDTAPSSHLSLKTSRSPGANIMNKIYRYVFWVMIYGLEELWIDRLPLVLGCVNQRVHSSAVKRVSTHVRGTWEANKVSSLAKALWCSSNFVTERTAELLAQLGHELDSITCRWHESDEI